MTYKSNFNLGRSELWQCLRKKYYMSEESVNRAIVFHREKYQAEMEKYKCPHCNWWHLTKVKDL